MIAGHETSHNTLSWALLELARNQPIQHRLRDEVRTFLLAAKADGRMYLEARELEKMTYLGAFLKVSYTRSMSIKLLSKNHLPLGGSQMSFSRRS